MKTLHYFIAGLFLTVSNLSEAQTAGAQVAQNQIIADDELLVVGVRYYFYPNLDAYFDTQTNLYVYEKAGQWIKSKELVSGYRGYSIMNNVRVEITDYNGDTPHIMLKTHQEQFPKKYSAKRKPPKVVKETKDARVAFN